MLHIGFAFKSADEQLLKLQASATAPAFSECKYIHSCSSWETITQFMQRAQFTNNLVAEWAYLQNYHASWNVSESDQEDVQKTIS